MEPWRLIFDPPLSGAENMAVDEAILRTAEGYYEDGVEQMPTLRLYSWSEPTVSIGYMQNARPFIEPKSKAPLVRRITGGRAVLHDMEITYSLVCPASHPLYTGGIEEAYRAVSKAIAGALMEFGVPVSFERGSVKRERGSEAKDACFLTTSRYEVVAGGDVSRQGGKKISGSAQRRFKGALLLHGSILLNIDKELTGEVFGSGIVNNIACVSDFTPLTPGGVDSLKSAFIEQLALAFDAEFIITKLSAPEYNLMQDLKEEKYAIKEWNEHNVG